MPESPCIKPDSFTLREKCRVWSYLCPYFSAFGLNTERYGVSNYIQSECRKTQTKKHCFIYNGKSKNIALYAYFCMFLKSLKAFIVP